MNIDIRNIKNIGKEMNNKTFYFRNIIFCYVIYEFINRNYLVPINIFNLKSASNLNGNLNCSKELEHYAS